MKGGHIAERPHPGKGKKKPVSARSKTKTPGWAPGVFAKIWLLPAAPFAMAMAVVMPPAAYADPVAVMMMVIATATDMDRDPGSGRHDGKRRHSREAERERRCENELFHAIPRKNGLKPLRQLTEIICPRRLRVPLTFIHVLQPTDCRLTRFRTERRLNKA